MIDNQITKRGPSRDLLVQIAQLSLGVQDCAPKSIGLGDDFRPQFELYLSAEGTSVCKAQHMVKRPTEAKSNPGHSDIYLPHGLNTCNMLGHSVKAALAFSTSDVTRTQTLCF